MMKTTQILKLLPLGIALVAAMPTYAQVQNTAKMDTATQAQLSEKYPEGDFYRVLDSKKTEQPQLTEYFSTFCPHCYDFEQFFDVVQQQIPQRTFVEQRHISWMGAQYGKPTSVAVATAQELGVDKVIIPALFEQIQKKQHPLLTKEEFKALFISHGVSATDFDSTYGSFVTLSRAHENDKSFTDLGLRGVPSIVINNKYLVEPKKSIDSAGYIELVNYLLKK